MTNTTTVEPTIWLRTIARENGIAISDEEIAKLDLFAKNLLEWNQKINLISRRDAENIWQAHILSSLSLLFVRDFFPETSVVDIGTGGGFPGVPLAILRPTVKFVLADSIAKKIKALDGILSGLGLQNVSTVCERAEVLSAREGYAGRFDYVVARAVSSVKELIKWGKPFLALPPIAGTPESGPRPLLPRGSMVLYKGGLLEDEIAQANVKFKPRNVEVVPLVIKGMADDAGKRLVIIQP